MIRFFKEEPFMAPMMFLMILMGFVFLGMMVASAFNPTLMRDCESGYVYVENGKTHGCVSEQVWKESQP